MPDRHSELPAHPDLEHYRKQAKHLLRSYEAGDAAARSRAADVLSDRAAGRFLLSDAQFVLAQEHGFRTWAEFRADIQSHRATGDRPVVRLWAAPSSYASQADGLLTELRRGDPDALQRVRANVPRYAAATDASAAELRDARLIIARELGFPTWRELVEAAEKAQRDDAERQEERRRLRPQAEALLAGDTGRLAQLTPGQADTLLQMLAGRELLGTKPGQGLGVPRAAVGGYERGWEQVSARLDWAAAGIKATDRAAENVVTVVGDDLACTVDLEHMTRHAGDHPTPRTLRCTQAYRRENGEWKVILRHADELPGKDEQQR